MGEILLPIHLIGLFVAIYGIFFADKEAFDWVFGKKPLLEEAKLKKYHYIVGTGLIILILSGIVIIWPAREFVFGNALFTGKMIFVLALVINSFFISKLFKITATRTFESLSTKEKAPLFISGVVSIISWLGAIITALMLFD